MNPTTVLVRHNFETAHRLPKLGGKCVNLHGHSWWLEASVTSVDTEKMSGDVVVDFGILKARIRNWVDANLDHATMLGVDDALVPALLEHGVRLFRFGHDEHAADLPWPTVEAVAVLLSRVVASIAGDLDDHLAVIRVRVEETHVNAAEWTGFEPNPHIRAVTS